MTRLFSLGLRVAPLGLWALAACAPSSVIDVDLGNGGTAKLAVTEPALLDGINSFVVGMFFRGAGLGCPELVDMTPEQIGEARLQQGDVSISQAIAKRDGEGDNAHAFGLVTPPGRYAHLVLGTLRVKDAAGQNFPRQSEPFLVVKDETIAVGCAEYLIEPGSAYDIQVTLLPAGLR